MGFDLFKSIKTSSLGPDLTADGSDRDQMPVATETASMPRTAEVAQHPSFLTDQETACKCLRLLAHGEVFRTSENRVGYAFKWIKSSEAYPWTHIVDLTDFSVLNYRTGIAAAPDFAYGLGAGPWRIRLGGAETDCQAGRPARAGDILVDTSGMWLIAGESNALYRYGLAGEADRKRARLGAVSGMLFERWSISNGDDAFATQLHFDSRRVRGADRSDGVIRIDEKARPADMGRTVA